jgi:hypothetical protein
LGPLALALTLLGAASASGELLRRQPRLVRGVEQVSAWLLAAFVVLILGPDVWAGAGAWGLAATGAGLLVPALLHRRGARQEAHALDLLGGLGALGVHAFADGLALGTGQSALIAGVLAHQLPVGLATWVAARQRAGTLGAALGLAAMSVGTSAGWWASREISLGPAVWGVAAFAAGGLLHGVMHRHGDGPGA